MNHHRPVFDLSILEEMEDNQLVIDVIGLYLKDAPKIIAEIKKFATDDDKKPLQQHAHKLKGSTAMLQAGDMMAVLEKIEAFSKSQLTHDENINDLVQQLQQQFEILKAALLIQLEEMKK